MSTTPYYGFHSNLPDTDYQTTVNAMQIGVFNNTEESLPLFLQMVFAPTSRDTFIVGDVTSAITSLRAYPFKVSNPPSQPDAQIVKILGKQLNANVSYVKLSSYTLFLDFGTITISKKFNNFIDYEPYTRLYLYLPFKGYIDLDNSVVLGKTLKINYVIDLSSGRSTIYIDVLENGTYRTIYTENCIIGIDIPTSNINGNMNNIQGMLAVYSTTMSMANAQAITKISSQVPTTLTGGLTGRGTTSQEGVAVEGFPMSGSLMHIYNASRPYVAHGTPAQGNGGWYGPTECFLVREYLSPVNYDDINSYWGKPLSQEKTLSDLTGFTIIDKIHLEDIGTATSNELNEIETLLKQGILL